MAPGLVESRERTGNDIAIHELRAGREWPEQPSAHDHVINPNKFRYTIWKVVRAGGLVFRLQVSGTKRCKGISSWRRCWGNTLNQISDGERRFDLADTLIGASRRTFQKAVTDACISRIGDRGRLEDHRSRPPGRCG